MVFVSVTIPGQPAPWLVGSIYIPHACEMRRQALKELASNIQRLKRRTRNEEPMIIMGDFNMSAGHLRQHLQRMGCGFLSVNPCRGSPLTWHRITDQRLLRSSTEHILSDRCDPALQHTAVDRIWDASDHWPIHCRWYPRPRNQSAEPAADTTQSAQRGLPASAPSTYQARILTDKSLAAFREKITNYQYINEEETTIEGSTIGKETQGDTEGQTRWHHDPRTRRITRESSSGKSPKKKKTSKKKTEE